MLSLKDLINPRRPAIIVPLTGADLNQLEKQMKLIPKTAELVEWRVDGFLKNHSLAELGVFSDNLAALSIPVLLTLRTGLEGGDLNLDSDEYIKTVKALMRFSQISLIDIEAIHPGAIDLLTEAKSLGLKTVWSKHYFSKTSATKIRKQQIIEYYENGIKAGADVVKLALTCVDNQHLLDLFAANQEINRKYPDQPLIAIAMGKLGAASRLIGGIFGSGATFAQLPAETEKENLSPTDGYSSAPGQLSFALTEKVLSALGQR